MLELRAATVVECDPEPAAGAEQRIVVELDDGARREAIADVGLVGRCELRDRVVVNVQALDLGLGSGGFDIVHVNLTRGLSSRAGIDRERAVMKLNYTSLQHAVAPVEDAELKAPLEGSAAVLALHGQLAPLAWAFSHAAPGARLGYVQTAGGALSGSRSDDVRELRARGLLAGHLTAAPAFGGEGEAMSVAGAIQHGLCGLGWDAVVCGPGPGITGSASALGHGGMAALDNLHAALALGCPTVAVARMSSGERRERHRGVSHHTRTVLDLVLAPVTVALPVGVPAVALVAAGTFDPTNGDGDGWAESRLARHEWREAAVDLELYAASGLPAQTMGRGIEEDQLFFASALAAGAVLGELLR